MNLQEILFFDAILRLSGRPSRMSSSSAKDLALAATKNSNEFSPPLDLCAAGKRPTSGDPGPLLAPGDDFCRET